MLFNDVLSNKQPLNLRSNDLSSIGLNTKKQDVSNYKDLFNDMNKISS